MDNIVLDLKKQSPIYKINDEYSTNNNNNFINLNIKKLNDNLIIPSKGSIDSAGYDLYINENIQIEPYQTLFIGLGFAIEIPRGYYAMIVPRSSVGRDGISLMNTIGVIDADYRGEVKAILKSNNALPIRYSKGKALLQMIIMPVTLTKIEVVTELSTTERGVGGFGSTDSKV